MSKSTENTHGTKEIRLHPGLLSDSLLVCRGILPGQGPCFTFLFRVDVCANPNWDPQFIVNTFEAWASMKHIDDERANPCGLVEGTERDVRLVKHDEKC